MTIRTINYCHAPIPYLSCHVQYTRPVTRNSRWCSCSRIKILLNLLWCIWNFTMSKKYTGVGVVFEQEDVFDELYYGVWFGRANVCFIFVIHIIWGLLSMFKLVSFTPSTTILPLEVWSSIFQLVSLEVRILSIHQFFVVSCWKIWLQVGVYWHRQFATN